MSASRDDSASPPGSLENIFNRSTRHSVKWNSYFPVYARTLARFVGKGITLVEVGVANGGSLLMWQSYLRDARIIEVDNNPRARELAPPGVEIVIGDLASPEFWDQSEYLNPARSSFINFAK